MLLAVLLAVPALAHDIPNDVAVQAFLKPQGDTLRLLVRVPLRAMRDFNFPERGASGYLDLDAVHPMLAGAATLWVSDFIDMYENGTKLPRASCGRDAAGAHVGPFLYIV